jgi:hypothetical protein
MLTEAEVVKKLQEHPELKIRFEQLLSIIENTRGDATRADDAEYQVIDQMRGLGHDVLQSWADRQSKIATERVIKQRPAMRKHIKKNCSGIQRMEK